MKYYARINKENVGPLSLKELVEAGIRPSTYVWCKGMPDWQHAEDNPEICRAMRRYLAGLDPETGRDLSIANTPSDETSSAEDNLPGNMPIGLRGIPEPPAQINYDVKPAGVSIFLAIIVTICCFPITGIVAIFFAMRCSTDWKMSETSGISDKERDKYRKKAYEDARIYKMMIGISIFMGLIMVGFTFSRTLL